MLSYKSISADGTGAALSSLEEATEIAVKAYNGMKAAGADKELLNSAVKEFRNIPLQCCNSAISADNTLTGRERYMACKAKLDALV